MLLENEQLLHNRTGNPIWFNISSTCVCGARPTFWVLRQKSSLRDTIYSEIVGHCTGLRIRFNTNNTVSWMVSPFNGFLLQFDQPVKKVNRLELIIVRLSHFYPWGRTMNRVRTIDPVWQGNTVALLQWTCSHFQLCFLLDCYFKWGKSCITIRADERTHAVECGFKYSWMWN